MQSLEYKINIHNTVIILLCHDMTHCCISIHKVDSVIFSHVYGQSWWSAVDQDNLWIV